MPNRGARAVYSNLRIINVIYQNKSIKLKFIIL